MVPLRGFELTLKQPHKITFKTIETFWYFSRTSVCEPKYNTDNYIQKYKSRQFENKFTYMLNDEIFYYFCSVI